MASVNSFKQILKDILDPITFGGTTLGAANIIKLYQKSIVDKPLTEVNIFSTLSQSSYLESKMNKRFLQVTIRIRCNAIDREEKAQTDLDELTESILIVLENNLSNPSWDLDGKPGFLNNESLEARTRNFDDNYFTVDIPLTIWQYVDVNN